MLDYLLWTLEANFELLSTRRGRLFGPLRIIHVKTARPFGLVSVFPPLLLLWVLHAQICKCADYWWEKTLQRLSRISLILYWSTRCAWNFISGLVNLLFWIRLWSDPKLRDHSFEVTMFCSDIDECRCKTTAQPGLLILVGRSTADRCLPNAWEGYICTLPSASQDHCQMKGVMQWYPAPLKFYNLMCKGGSQHNIYWNFEIKRNAVA